MNKPIKIEKESDMIFNDQARRNRLDALGWREKYEEAIAQRDDLLAACEEIMDWLTWAKAETCPVYPTLKAAIAKTKGG